jgi:hypothetical protein
MSTTAVTSTARRELARRVSGGLEITLFWDSRDNSTSIDIYDAATDDTISFRVPPGRALDAFHHPFAHLEKENRTRGFSPDHIDETVRNSR